jgi:hypothetical protein
MSAISEILERLSGIAVLREKLNETSKRVEKTGEWLLDHEKRLTVLETIQKTLTAPK